MDVAENLQARIGALLMAMSNKFGHLLLTTGNKSELATGYCTIYGDMAGGLAVISDVPKTMVFRLARLVNDPWCAFPCRPSKAPSASCARTKKTKTVCLYVPGGGRHRPCPFGRGQGCGRPYEAMIHDRDQILLIRINEYKRRQMPPGLKITGKAFGSGRRYPIAQAYAPERPSQQLIVVRGCVWGAQG